MSLIRPVGTPFTFIPTDSRGNTVTACNAGSGYLKTGATGGFLYVPQMSGAPSSTGATGYTGTVAMCFDTQNNMPWYLNPNNTFGGSTGPAKLNWVAGNGQVLIGRTILTSATGGVSFTGISQAFNHLRAVSICRGDVVATIGSFVVRLNGDAGSNYNFSRLDTSGSVGTAIYVSQTAFNQIGVYPGSSIVANCSATNIFDIPFYTNTTFNKTIINVSSVNSTTSNQNFTRNGYGNWMSTSPITSITFSPNSDNFIAGSGFFLYGVW